MIYCQGEALSPLAEKNLSRLTGGKLSGNVKFYRLAGLSDGELDMLIKKSDIILDGVFGTGFRGTLPPELKRLLKAVNGASAFKAALDIPTGINGDTGLFDQDSFRADVTYTFAARKPAHVLKTTRVICGKTETIDIGIPETILDSAPESIIPVSRELARSFLPKRSPGSNKGDYGKLLLIEGCGTMTGAALLSAMAAARCGVGLLMTAVPEIAIEPVRIRLPEALQYPLPLSASGAIDVSVHPSLIEKGNRWASGVLCGCGLSLTDETKALVGALIEENETPLVLDADGLNALAAIGTETLLNKKSEIILTPHMMEFSRLSGLTIPEIRESRFTSAARFAEKYRVTLVLKDASTVIASPGGTIYINENGNSGLSKGGSGDVLAGIIASFLAQGLSPEKAAALGVYLHAEAGDIAAERLSEYAMLPEDVIGCLAEGFKRII